MPAQVYVQHAKDCPDVQNHSKPPKRQTALEFFDWCQKMRKTHTQHQCPTCGFWVIWEPKK